VKIVRRPIILQAKKGVEYMKKTIIIALLTIAICTTDAYSQKQNQPFEKTNASAQKIIQFMTDWTNLSNRHDITGLDKMLPADLVLTFQDGAVQTKDEYIFALKKNPNDFTIKDFDQKVDLYDENVAIVRARYEVAAGQIKAEFRYTVTFLKRKGRWEPIAFHSSPLDKK
jgi:ketosteroid isomerase-like protein